MNRKIYLVLCLYGLSLGLIAQGDGYLQKGGKRLFPIGSYHLPSDDGSLKEMVNAGFNLFRCESKADLDRLQKFGVQGWIPLPLAEGVTERLKKLVGAVAGHPALAVWEGPDEIVWSFTANSGLFRDQKIHKSKGAWWSLSSEAITHARKQSEVIMPKINEAIAYVRSVDPNNLQVWINEAKDSDMGYVNQYINAIDISGCDTYPIKSSQVNGNLRSRPSMLGIGKDSKRWIAASEGKPVWMVLQAFSWHELGALTELYKNRPIAYPSFRESRYMAYDVIANGTRGINYWNMKFLTLNEFRESLYALTNELDALQPFLTTDNKPVTVTTYHEGKDADAMVVATVRQYGRDWMVALVNESDTTQMGVVVEGLPHLNGLKLVELYGEDEVLVRNGKIIIRMEPFEVKVFTTSRKWEAVNKKGRTYPGL